MRALLLIGHHAQEEKAMAMTVDQEKCIGCGACEAICPTEAITLPDDKAVIDTATCIACGACIDQCPEDAIREEA